MKSEDVEKKKMKKTERKSAHDLRHVSGQVKNPGKIHFFSVSAFVKQVRLHRMIRKNSRPLRRKCSWAGKAGGRSKARGK